MENASTNASRTSDCIASDGTFRCKPGMPLPQKPRSPTWTKPRRGSVIAFAEGSDEVEYRGLEVGMLIVGRAAAAVLSVGSAADRLRQIAGHPGWLGRVVQVYPQNRVVSTASAAARRGSRPASKVSPLASQSDDIVEELHRVRHVVRWLCPQVGRKEALQRVAVHRAPSCTHSSVSSEK